MSLDRKTADAARTLKPAANPALRLQELLRREAQAPKEDAPAPPAPAAGDAPPPAPPVQLRLKSVPEPDAPPAMPAPPARGEAETVTLVVLLNSERSTPVEYASPEAMPTAQDLQETHQAYLLSDEWHRRGAALVRTVRLRRRRR